MGIVSFAEDEIPLTIENVVAHDREYDGTGIIELTGGTLVGVDEGDDVSFDLGLGQAHNQIGQVNVITNIQLTGEDAYKYVLVQPQLTAEIRKKVITIENVSVSDKIYDGTKSMHLCGGKLVGVVSGDDVSFDLGTGVAFSENVGNVNVATSIMLTGLDKRGYTLKQPDYLTANIEPKPVFLSGLQSQDKIYDGSTTVKLNGGTLFGVLEGDSVEFELSGYTDSKLVGERSVIIESQLKGVNASNYVLVSVQNLSVKILPLEISISDVIAVDREYNGEVTVKLTGGNLIGVIANDDVSFILGNGIINNKNAEDYKTVYTNITLVGNDCQNYALNQPKDITVSILKKTLTISGVSANNKIYDGTTDITLNGGSLDGVLPNDDVRFDLGVGSVESKNAENDKSVSTQILLTGIDKNNYKLIQPENIKANISKKTIRLENVSAINRPTDKTNIVSFTGGNLVGVIKGDDVSFVLENGTINGTKKGNYSVSVKANLIGKDIENYTFSKPENIIVEIYAKDTTAVVIILSVVLSLTFVIFGYLLFIKRTKKAPAIAINEKRGISNSLENAPENGEKNEGENIYENDIIGKKQNNEGTDSQNGDSVSKIENENARLKEKINKIFQKNQNQEKTINDLNISLRKSKEDNEEIVKKLMETEEFVNYYRTQLNNAEKSLKTKSDFENATLNFLGQLFLYKYNKEDYNTEITTEALMLRLDMFLKQTLRNKDIMVICADYEDDKFFDEKKHIREADQVTNDLNLNGKIYRTAAPGIMYGDFVIKEKVIVWKYEEN